MRDLTYQRCYNHASREAAAQCPVCGGYFCRECVTEHEDRVVCTKCLKKLAGVPFVRRPAFVNALSLLRGLVGLMIAWFFFFLIGQRLIALPDAFHEGKVWRIEWIDEE